MIILVFLIIILLFFFLTYISTLKVTIINFDADNINKKEKQIKDFQIKINLVILNKIKWIGFKIDRKRIEKVRGTKLNNILNKLFDTKIMKDYNKLGQIIFRNRKEIIKDYKKLKVNIEKVNLKLKFGTTNVITTTFLFTALSTFIPTILSNSIQKYKSDIHKFSITPIYNQENFYDLTINCIISVKIAHIINMIYIKKRSGRIDARTSDRIFNGNSHEQYTRIS